MTMLMIDKVVPPQRVGPLSIYRHDIPDADLRRAQATDDDLYNGRLHEGHVIRLFGSYVVFSKNEPLPPGGFSDNYVGVHSSLGFVAVKRLRAEACFKRDGKSRCAWTPEAQIEKEVDLARRVGLHAAPRLAVRTKTKAYIISPLFEGDAMYLAALGETRYPRAVLLHRFIADVARHLQHMHQQGVLHNDVKPNNVLVHKREGDLHFVLCDYGLSCELTPHAYPGGNAWYGAPEETLDFKPEARSDVYSLGISCMTLLNNCNPFDAIFSEYKGDVPPEEVRIDAYACFESVRRGEYCENSKFKNIFSACWRDIEAAAPPAVVALIKDMVALPLKGENQRIGITDILQRLPSSAPRPEDLQRWLASVGDYNPGNIANAKRQVRIVEDALIKRGRLDVPPRHLEPIQFLGRDCL